MTSQASRPFRCTDRVRWADVDLVGIMRYSAVTRFLDTAEQELLREAGLPYGDIYDTTPDIWMPRRHLAIEYLSPARIDDLLHMILWITRLGESSMSFVMELRQDDGRPVAVVNLVAVCVTADTFTKRPLPRVVRDSLARFVCTPEEARASLG